MLYAFGFYYLIYVSFFLLNSVSLPIQYFNFIIIVGKTAPLLRKSQSHRG